MGTFSLLSFKTNPVLVIRTPIIHIHIKWQLIPYPHQAAANPSKKIIKK